MVCGCYDQENFVVISISFRKKIPFFSFILLLCIQILFLLFSFSFLLSSLSNRCVFLYKGECKCQLMHKIGRQFYSNLKYWKCNKSFTPQVMTFCYHFTKALVHFTSVSFFHLLLRMNSLFPQLHGC